MKKQLFLLLFLPLLAFTQVPQGVGYQGVATDAAGFELINQSISIRASVISGSATGTIEWQETHNTSTDTFGLFNLTIGQGVSTGNGALTSFADITWGANTHFLKIEMDVNGGTNYSHMGTNQMMSVPYALYAENANINYDSIATIISNDSSFLNYFGSGCISFGEREELNITLTQNLTHPIVEYQASVDGFLSGSVYLYGSNAKVWFWSDSISGGSTLRAFFKNSVADAGSAYQSFTIPIKSGDYYNFTSLGNTSITNVTYTKIDCGGSSSSSTIDSSYIDSLVQFYSSGNGGGCDFDYPDGLDGDAILVELTSSSGGGGAGVLSYTVPPNKNLYITSFNSYNMGQQFNINSLTIFKGTGYYNSSGDKNGHFNLPIICSSGDIISTDNGSGARFTGILTDQNVSPITFTGNYTIPSGKKLVILNYYSDDGGILNVDGVDLLNGCFNLHIANSSASPTPAYMSIKIPLIFNANSQINQTIGSTDVINGYLVDEDYFTNCGDGGSSSSSTVDSSYIDSLVQFYSSGGGGGCDLKYPEGVDGDGIIWDFAASGSYTVPSGKTLYINNFYSNNTSNTLTIDGIQVREGKTNYPYVVPNSIYEKNNYLTSPIIASSGQTLSIASQSNLSTFSGMLVDENNIQAITYCLSSTSTCGSVPGGVFTVPPGKKLYILSYYAQGTMGNLNIDNIIIKEGKTNVDDANSFNLPVIVNSAQTVSSTNAGPNSFNGYLVDENYFADCGGGGSSSSTSSLDSLTIVSMINNITNNNQSIGVGDYYQGGVVGYIFQPGDSDYVFGETHGYIIRQGPGNDWGCIGVTTNVINNNIGQGPNNTHILDSLCTESNFAAKWCSDLVVGTYDDWFLPTYQEAILIDPSIYINHTTITNNNNWNMWLSEEFSPNPNPYNYNCPSCSSDNYAWSLNYLGGTWSIYEVSAHLKNSGASGKVVAFRKF